MAIVIHIAIMGCYVYRSGGKLSVLVCAGTSLAKQPEYRSISKTMGAEGYDGQFYYVIAQSPFSKQTKRAIILPGSRQMRLLYPGVCWLLSGGDPDVLLWVMPAVNLLAIGGIAVFGWAFARRFGANPWWGLLLLFASGASLSGLRDLTDPLATLALCWLLWTWFARSPWWGVALASICVAFSREQNVGIILVLVVMHFWHGNWKHAGSALAACFAFGGWVILLRNVYPPDTFLPVDGNFDLPLQGWIRAWDIIQDRYQHATLVKLYFSGSLIYIACLAIIGAVLAAYPRREWVPCWIALAGTVMAAIAGRCIYEDVWGYSRVLVWIPFGIWLVCIQNNRTRPLWLLCPTVLWVVANALRPNS